MSAELSFSSSSCLNYPSSPKHTLFHKAFFWVWDLFKILTSTWSTFLYLHLCRDTTIWGRRLCSWLLPRLVWCLISVSHSLWSLTAQTSPMNSWKSHDYIWIQAHSPVPKKQWGLSAYCPIKCMNGSAGHPSPMWMKMRIPTSLGQERKNNTSG